MMSWPLIRRITSNMGLLGRAPVAPTVCHRSKLSFAVGILYRLLPVDLIPNHIFLIGYLDNVVVLPTASAVAWMAIPWTCISAWQSPTSISDHDVAWHQLWKTGCWLDHQRRTLRWRGRMALATLLGTLLCRPVLRLVLGRPARRLERIAFGEGTAPAPRHAAAAP